MNDYEAFNKFFYGDNKQEAKADAGKPQLWHLACNIAFLCELEEMP